VVSWPAPLVDALITHGHAEAVDPAEPLYVPAMPFVS
jgi:hypothetical protein